MQGNKSISKCETIDDGDEVNAPEDDDDDDDEDDDEASTTTGSTTTGDMTSHLMKRHDDIRHG